MPMRHFFEIVLNSFEKFARISKNVLAKVDSLFCAGWSFISVAGFLLFWLGTTSIVNITGLFLTGLGIANMYPLSFAAAVAAAENQSSKAIARVSLVCGGALLAMPVGLSFIADRAGLFNAYYVVAFDLLICLGTIFWAGAISRRRQSHSL
jgi:fucose permease